MDDYSKIYEQWKGVKGKYNLSDWIDFNKNYIYEDDMAVTTLFEELAYNFEVSIIGSDAFKIVKDIIIFYIEKGANPFDTHEHIAIKQKDGESIDNYADRVLANYKDNQNYGSDGNGVWFYLP